jgi:phosphoglycolate phosphatase
MMKDRNSIEALALDLDGTLVDTALDIGLALNTALVQAGLPKAEMSAVRSWIGDGPDVLISRALASQGMTEPSAELRITLRQGFDVATLKAPLVDGKVYPGIASMMEQLHRRLPMVVVTNKPTALARAVLDAAGLLPMLTQVWGADDHAHKKPAPALLLRAATQLNIAPGHLLMVGDGPADLLSAHAAGCPAVLVGWGYGTHAIPSHLQPERIDTPAQLLDRLQQHSPVYDHYAGQVKQQQGA